MQRTLDLASNTDQESGQIKSNKHISHITND